ncbi:MAG TPA: tetratricopeptide repeat protein [Ardenticatenaceae bacterium]|nr:tetratricopeptide repeat protein [Ardenticatenaceae bacterium]
MNLNQVSAGGNIYIGASAAEQPAIFRGVPPMPPQFLGRDELVASVAARLIAGESLALDGLPGVGKTTLAVAVAHHRGLLRHFHDGVLWAGLGPRGDVLAALVTWGQALGVDVTQYIDEAERSQAVKDAIGHHRLLLVIDDAWDAQAARWMRCGGPYCSHLLTTRDKGIARAFVTAKQAAQVPVLEDRDAVDLLQALAPEVFEIDAQASGELALAVGGLPLVLELLGGYLAAPEHNLFPELASEALAEMRNPERRLELAAHRLGSRKTPAVTLRETIELSLEGLAPEVSEAFYALGAFAARPGTFDLPAAEAVTGAGAKVIAVLAARNLLEHVEGQLGLHQMVAEVARTQVSAEALARHCAHYLALVEENRHNWRRIEAIYGQVQQAWAALPEDESVLDYVWALRLYHQRRGLWRQSLGWGHRGLAVAERAGHRGDVATLLNNIGLVYDNLGQRQQALEYYQRALPISEEVGDRAGLATTLNNIGAVYDRLGQRQQALEYYQRALPIQEEVGDRAAESVTRYNLAMLHREEGRLREAVAELKRVVELDVLVQHPDLEADRAMLAQVEAELQAQEEGRPPK